MAVRELLIRNKRTLLFPNNGGTRISDQEQKSAVIPK